MLVSVALQTRKLSEVSMTVKYLDGGVRISTDKYAVRLRSLSLIRICLGKVTSPSFSTIFVRMLVLLVEAVRLERRGMQPRRPERCLYGKQMG